MSAAVRAAGAVLFRGGDICVVHRPRYADWSLPKGKLKSDEHPLTAAVRELSEETGVRGEPLLRLPDVAYSLPDGRAKTVEFWLMRAAGAAPFTPDDEVDEVAFLSPAEAIARLTYPTDRTLVSAARELPEITSVTPIVRHAHAGERKNWNGNDALRPIDPQGAGEAQALAELLPIFAPQRLFAATPLRCRQTLEPLAAKLNLPIVSDAAFAEPADTRDREKIRERVGMAVARLADLRTGPTAVVCSQGKVMPHILAEVAGDADAEDYKTPKGGGWVIAWAGATAAGISRL